MSFPPDECEKDLLRRSWERHDADALDTYLVSGVEDPRINVPSILTRVLLNDTLFPAKFTTLIEEELRFGFVMTWLLTHLEMGISRESLMSSIRGNHHHGRCPDFVLDSFQRLQEPACPIPDYVTASLEKAEENAGTGLPNHVLDTFQRIWSDELARLSHSGYSLFEPACGSANDYRYLDSFGLGRFFRYTGLDIAPKNIANARRRFPRVDFRVGDLLDTGIEPDTFDFAFVHDLFEHLSAPAIEQAFGELLRVTCRDVWFHFFHAADLKEHCIRPMDLYYWNTLSLDRLVDVIEPLVSHLQVFSIADFGRTKFGFNRYYNAGAYVIIATK